MRRLAILALTLPIRCYRLMLSPFTPMACRYLPTCSAYAVDAVTLHGPLAGGWLALRRLARCHPLGGHGYDPVPPPRASLGGGRHAR